MLVVGSTGSVVLLACFDGMDAVVVDQKTVDVGVDLVLVLTFTEEAAVTPKV